MSYLLDIWLRNQDATNYLSSNNFDEVVDTTLNKNCRDFRSKVRLGILHNQKHRVRCHTHKKKLKETNAFLPEIIMGSLRISL